MNERIQELELEAIAYADSKVPVNDRYNDIYHSIVRGKFAELIVKECITLGTNFTNRNYSDDAGERIAKHFGVEE